MVESSPSNSSWNCGLDPTRLERRRRSSGLSTSTLDISQQVQQQRLAQQVQSLQDQQSEVARFMEEHVQLRWAVEANADQLRVLQESDVNLQNRTAVEKEREARSKALAEIQAAVDVARGRVSRLEGTMSVHAGRFKEMDVNAEKLRVVQHGVEALQRAFDSSESQRRSSCEMLESKMRDEMRLSMQHLKKKAIDAVDSVKTRYRDLESKLSGVLKEQEATTARLDARQQAEADTERDNALRLKAGLEAIDANTAHELEKLAARNDSNLASAQESLAEAIKAAEMQLMQEVRQVAAGQDDAHFRTLSTRVDELEGELRSEARHAAQEHQRLLECNAQASLSKTDELSHKLDDFSKNSSSTIAHLSADLEDLSAKIKDELRCAAQGHYNKLSEVERLVSDLVRSERDSHIPQRTEVNLGVRDERPLSLVKAEIYDIENRRKDDRKEGLRI
uniref:Uncharacterized protein n=1 Tax=Noctiluca scintillans TaxID=2966 RepID=A0A7S1B3R3_NOCSC|eukprot:CAMPEP_0194490564 /NCGR_PEP_ID=MMETSP0253-20130528/9738_1 /TAXON_ID=2966 /ORGANISM="Noctiluca scintillans" /LENGTH=448 /DNA_ID=CAMNT_0039331207 /DNA_START=55 /DNA_END=1401 /DNA_ORIENTATION=-